MQTSSFLKLTLRAIAFGLISSIFWTVLGESINESWPKTLGMVLGWTLVEFVRLFFVKRRALRS